MEESSSLKNQKLFLRRPDLSVADRLDLAIAGLSPSHRDCTISELKARYKVSHTFIYDEAQTLRAHSALLFGSVQGRKDSPLEEVLRSIRFFLEGKMETKSALQGLSNLASSIGIKYTSTCFISKLLELTGSLVGGTYSSDQPLLVTVLCDEVYSGGEPILVTIEAQSMMALDIRLVDGSLLSSDWEASFERLDNAQISFDRLIKDQGTQMASAIKVLPSQTIIGADSFHAIPHRLGLYHCRLKKEVELCELRQADRATRFFATKTFATAFKKEAEWEAAKLKTLQAIDQLEWFDEHYFKMIQQLRPFTSQGLARSQADAQYIIKESLAALSLLEYPKLQKHLNHIEGLLDNGQLLHYMDQVPILHQNLQEILEPETSWLWMLYWQWDKKSYQTHSPKVQKRTKQEALAAKELLEEYYQTGSTKGQMNPFASLRQKVFTTLDNIVQASSLVETFNSILKPFINNTRGQVSQELLNLVQFYHNHRVFKRGKRQNKAPIEILTGQPLEKSWIDLLIDKLRIVFEQQNLSSVKQLHQLLCPKKKAQKAIKETAIPLGNHKHAA